MTHHPLDPRSNQRETKPQSEGAIDRFTAPESLREAARKARTAQERNAALSALRQWYLSN